MGIPTLGTTLVNLMNQSKRESIIGYFTAVYTTGQIIGPVIAELLASSNNDYNSSLIGAAVIVLIGACLLLTGVKFQIKSSTVSKELS